MSQAQPAEARETTKSGFYDTVRTEGVTIDGVFYASTGTGKQTRYHAYDPGLVKGLEAIREDGEVVGNQVTNHDEAVEHSVPKGDLEDIYEKFADGFGSRGLYAVEDAPEPEDDEEEEETEVEPLDDEELADTIRENFEERGFFAEDEEGDTKVVSLAHPDGKLMGYITGSHVKALPADIESVDDYRNAVAAALLEGGYDGLPSDFGPDDVPVAPDDLMETFTEAGQSIRDDEELRERLSHQVSQRWEDGSYDHLRGAQPEDG